MIDRINPSRSCSLNARRRRAGYWFVLPFCIGFLVFFFSPMVFYVVMAFSKMSLTNNGMNFTGNGLDNFKELLLNDPQYVVSVVESLQPLLLNLFAIVLYSLFVAILMNQKFAGRGFFRAVFFLPVVVASGSAALSGSSDKLLSNAQLLLNGGSSVVDMGKDITQTIVSMFGSTGATQRLVSVVSTVVSGMYTITQASGVQILIFLAGLQSINGSLYEAAKMDGATGWESFWKITLPLISPMILVNAVYTIIDSFTTESNVVMTFISKKYSSTNGQVLSSAMSWIYFMIVIVIVSVIAAIISAFVFYQRKAE